ncbi:MAG: nucleoside-diphosphate kinase [Dehalococcoidia bacterium]
MSDSQRTLVLLKPDAVQRGLVGTIIERFERTGLRIAGMKLIQIDEALARRHYGVHEGKPFFEGLVGFITSSPVVAMVLEGPRAVEVARKTMGATDPGEAAPGTIRGDLGLTIGRNLVHGSDGPETAEQEVPLFFRPDELLDWTRDSEGWVIE